MKKFNYEPLVKRKWVLNITHPWIILTENNHSGAPRVNKKGTQLQQKKNLAFWWTKWLPSFTKFFTQEIFLKLPINCFIPVEWLPPHPGGLGFLLHYPFLPHKIRQDLHHKYNTKMSMSLVTAAHCRSLQRNILRMQWECCLL